MRGVPKVFVAYGGAIAGLLIIWSFAAIWDARTVPPFHCHTWTLRDTGKSFFWFVLLVPLALSIALKRSSIALFSVALVVMMVAYTLAVNWREIMPCSPL